MTDTYGTPPPWMNDPSEKHFKIMISVIPIVAFLAGVLSPLIHRS